MKTLITAVCTLQGQKQVLVKGSASPGPSQQTAQGRRRLTGPERLWHTHSHRLHPWGPSLSFQGPGRGRRTQTQPLPHLLAGWHLPPSPPGSPAMSGNNKGQAVGPAVRKPPGQHWACRNLQWCLHLCLGVLHLGGPLFRGQLGLIGNNNFLPFFIVNGTFLGRISLGLASLALPFPPL